MIVYIILLHALFVTMNRIKIHRFSHLAFFEFSLDLRGKIVITEHFPRCCCHTLRHNRCRARAAPGQTEQPIGNGANARMIFPANRVLVDNARQ